MIPLRLVSSAALLLVMVLISVGQAAGGDPAATTFTSSSSSSSAATKHGGTTWTPPASPPTAAARQRPSLAPGPLRDGVILFTEFASPPSTFPSGDSATTNQTTTSSSTTAHNPLNYPGSGADDAGTFDEQLVLTEKVINFDAESTAPPLNELTGNGAVARDPNNGLFRIKIAEIITDEFDNGLDPDAVAYDQQRRIAAYQNAGKIKLTDLYPSKLEDFGPIIRQSNERLINDKHVFVQDDGDEAARRADDEELRGHVVLNSYEPAEEAADDMRRDRGQLSRMPTTKIEIELIDDVDETAAAPMEGKVSDFTRELLRDNDGVINTIERSFVNVSPQRGDGERVIAMGGSINKALDGSGFIERRVKKLDPMALGKQETVEHVTHVEKTEEEEHSTKEKPEFSTTKFYNSKELYSEMMHKKLDDVVAEVKTTTTDPAAVVVTQAETQVTPSSATVLTTTPVADKAKTFNINTPKAANKLKKVVKKILAVSKPSKMKTTMKATVEAASTTALPSSSSPVSPTQTSEDATPLATAKERPPTTLLTTTAAIASSAASVSAEGPTPTSSASPLPEIPSTETTAGTTAGPLTTTTTQTVRNAAVVRPPVHIALPIAAETEESSSTQRPAVALHVPSSLSRLQEKLNVLECEMPGELATDVNVWRGNETHELNLPNTVSFVGVAGSQQYLLISLSALVWYIVCCTLMRYGLMHLSIHTGKCE